MSPQNLTIAAIAATAVGVRRESDLLSKTVLWSVGLLVVLCLLIGLQVHRPRGLVLP